MQNGHSTHIAHTHTVHTHAYTHIQWEAIVRAVSVHTVSLYGMKLESLDGSCIPGFLQLQIHSKAWEQAAPFRAVVLNLPNAAIL